MVKCEHGTENCIHLGVEHDDDSCFNGWWEHEYVCQECGHTMMSRKHSLKVGANGLYVAPGFKPKNCPRCKSVGSFV